MTTGIEHDGPASTGFRGRIDHRLSVVFVSLFLLVLMVGATSLYLLGSLLLRSQEIGRESEQVHLVERMHRTLQYFFSAVQQAQLQGRAVPDSLRQTSMADLESLLTLYRRAGGTGENVREFQQIVADAERLTRLDARDPQLLEATHRQLRVFTERISAEHETSELRHVQQTRRNLRITIGFNVAFVLLGALFLLGSQRYFHRAIALPLRRLAERSSEIARGDLPAAMPVTSSDEIGRLSDAFNRMGQQLREHEERLKGLTIVEERERLARELHDNLAQDLAFLRLKLIEADRSLAAASSPETKRLVGETFAIVDGAYGNLRQAIFGLHALDLRTKGGFVPALTEYLRDFSDLRGLPVTLQAPDSWAFRLPPQAETHLIRIVHEALTNIVKHAQATRAAVILERDGGAARITIEDDGKGFLVEQAPDDGLHFGLTTMKERAEAVGGTLTIESAPGHGTRVIVRVPLAGP